MDTKALRQKVLDLAIRGKLVPQDPNDEPASVLLERIRQQKQQMVKDGKLKAKDIKNDTIIFVGEDNLHYEKFASGSVKCIEEEIPFDLPEGWVWVRLSSIADMALGKMLDVAKNKGSLRPYLRNVNVRWGTFELSDVLDMRFEDDELERYSIRHGDLVICEGGEPGRCAVWQSEEVVFYQKALHRVRAIEVLPEYLYYVIRHFITSTQYERYYTGTTIKHLTGQSLQVLPIPLPPMSEQQLIVKHLQHIIGEIDKVETEKSEALSLVSLAKSKILNLAISGQLVPQDPADEPASVLLERIRAEKEELIKQGKLKRDKKESVIFRGEDNSYYLRTGDLVESLEDWAFEELPDSWAICCLGELCDYGNCLNVDTVSISDSAWILDLEDIEKDSGVVLRKVRKSERNAASTKHFFHRGQVLYSKLRPYLNKVVLPDEDGYCTSEILPLEFERNVLPQYARYYLMSPVFLEYANKCSYGVKMPRLGTVDGKKSIISIPPIEEQKRIVLAIEQAFTQLAAITRNLL